MVVSYASAITNTLRTPGNGNTAMTITTAAAAVGDVITVLVVSEDQATSYRPGAPTATGITFNLISSAPPGSYCWLAIYTGTVTTAGAKTITLAATTTSGILSGALAALTPAADGYSAPTSANVVQTNSATGFPTIAASTIPAGSLALWCSGDWSAVNGAGRTYQSGNTDQGYARDSAGAHASEYWGSCISAGGGTPTLGLASPTGQKWDIAAVSIPKTGAAAPAPNFFAFL